MIETIKNNKLFILIGVLALPLFLTVINATILTIFNLGIDLGTFFRVMTTVC